MSAKDAPSEVNNNPNFDSVDFSSDEELDPELEEKAEELRLQKERETVKIDGVPIDEKKVEYKASDIKKKGRMNYFVNIEGAEERARAAEKKANSDKAASERRIHEAEAAAEKQKRIDEDEANKKLIEEKRRTDEINKYLKRQSSEKKRTAKKAYKEENKDALRKRRNSILRIAGIATAVVVLAIVIIVPIVLNAQEQERIRREEEAEAAASKAILGSTYVQIKLKLDSDTYIINAFENYNYERIDQIYDDFDKQLEDYDEKAMLYMDKSKRILRYSPSDSDQILAAAEKAYDYSPRNIEVLSNLAFAYTLVGDTENAELANQRKNLIIEEQNANNDKEEGEHAG